MPKDVAHLDPRGVIRETLKTRSENEAKVMADEMDKAVEAYWAALLVGRDATDSRARYDAAISTARSLGFVYRSAAEIVKLGRFEVAERLDAASLMSRSEQSVEAILGTVEEPDIKLSSLVSTYLTINKVALAGKSDAQLKKHTSQRNGAVAIAIEVIGDKALDSITKADTIAYRQHWSDRVAAGEINRESANRSISDVKGMLSVLDYTYGRAWGAVWDELRIKGKKQTKEKRRRQAYSLEFVQTKLLAPGALDDLNEDARYVLYGMVETGMGISEACNLRPEDIVLDHAIPHVRVAERDDREQKTVYRIREIPLVGVSHWAFKQRPGGFPRYRDKNATLSNTINKFLRENGLQPTERHSAYSLRHTFQDRLLAIAAPDRLQVDLMGHDLGRPDYGAGATLQQKLDALEKIKFQWNDPVAARTGGA